MTFSEKLVLLRKEKGLSQEELAEILEVSRQSVSKWESGQSLPDYPKLLILSNVFDVSTDYLLKDQINKREKEELINNEKPKLREISFEEAKAFLEVKQKTAQLIATGVFLCIISPIWIIMFAGFSYEKMFGFTENIAAGFGVSLCLILVAIAVGIFIYSANQISSYNFLEKKPFSIDEETFNVINHEKKNYKNTSNKNLVYGVGLCILASIPILLSVVVGENNTIVTLSMVCLTLFIVAVGVYILVKNNIKKESYNVLLQEGSYTKEKKRIKPTIDLVTSIYWSLIVLIYLWNSFSFNSWNRSWIIFIVGAILYSIFITILERYLLRDKTTPDE